MSRADENLPGMIGRHPTMRQVYRLVRAAAPTNLPVLIVGETGTGKELVARAVHHLSANGRHHPLVDINCAAIPEHLCEGELFGWEKGAFTGAEKNNTGLLDAADGGTLFLDEICTMPMHLQAKLLRAIELQEFRRVGGRQPIRTQFRLVAAASQPVSTLVRAGRLREDLAYRLAGVTVELPPLRKRGDDIRLLAESFITDNLLSCATDGFTRNVVNVLKQYHWPGNVRELKNAIARLSLLTPQGALTEASIHAVLPQSTPSIKSRDALERVLEEHDWRVAAAARALSIPRSTLRDRMRALGVKRPVVID